MGVVLFTMITRTPPYKFKCDKSDPYYKFFIEKNEKQFWEKFTKTNGLSPDFFSTSFMDLINKMITNDPQKRITIPEIKMHEWVLKDTLTLDQLRDEMTIRLFKKESLKKKIEENLQLMKHKKSGQGQNLAYNGILHFRSLSLNVISKKGKYIVIF